MAFFFSPFKLIFERFTLLMSTSIVEIRSTYAGSVLGVFWVALGPLLLLTIYGLVYAVIFRIRPVEMSTGEYVMYVFSGLVPFIAFASALTAGATSLSVNKQFLLNTVFPAELIPVRSVLVACISMPVGFVILIAGDFAISEVSWTTFLVPVFFLLQVMFLCGLAWVLSLLTLLIRDIQQLLVYTNMFLLVVTPIAYTPSMVPDSMKFLMYLNPLYYYVASYQSLIVLNKLPDLPITVICMSISIGSFCLGFRIYKTTKQVFFDYA